MNILLLLLSSPNYSIFLKSVYQTSISLFDSVFSQYFSIWTMTMVSPGHWCKDSCMFWKHLDSCPLVGHICTYLTTLHLSFNCPYALINHANKITPYLATMSAACFYVSRSCCRRLVSTGICFVEVEDEERLDVTSFARWFCSSGSGHCL